MEFPVGLLPPGTVMAETRLARAAVSAITENCILGPVWSFWSCSSLLKKVTKE